MTADMMKIFQGPRHLLRVFWLTTLLVVWQPAVYGGETRLPVRLERTLGLSLDSPFGQLRAVPVQTAKDRPPDILLIYSEDEEIDPYIGMFFFPKGTTKLRLITTEGKTKWVRDLGQGVVSGIWFLPVFPFDLDGNGIDEIWFVNNTDRAHPLDFRKYVLECADSSTGKMLKQHSWPEPNERQSMSHIYRNFILGGIVRGEPVLVTAQGTYDDMQLQGWKAGLSPRWAITVPAKSAGARGSHMCAVTDLDNDGSDEVLWGERCISLDTGRQLFCCDEDRWSGHSDIVQPFHETASDRWFIHTCREQMSDTAPRMVVFDAMGNRVWSALETGHIDTGWAARLGNGSRHVVLGVRVGAKTRSAQGETRTQVESFTFDGLTGKPHALPFEPYTTIPVDVDGDGLHELVRGYFEGNGDVLNRNGAVLGNVGGLVAMASKLTRFPGEQILSYDKKRGRVMLWRDVNAQDSPAALARYAHPFYRTNQRLTACGYNLWNLGGI
jgi:hypothetical protein